MQMGLNKYKDKCQYNKYNTVTQSKKKKETSSGQKWKERNGKFNINSALLLS